MELAVNVSLNDCQATNIRDWPSKTRLPPSSSSYMPRYRLTSIGGEKLSPWSRETDTNVASEPEATNEFQETAKVPSGETATEGAEALDTSGGETPVDRSQDRDFTRRKIRVDDVGGPTVPDGNAGPFDIAGCVVEAGAQIDGDGISEGPAPVQRAPDLEVGRRRTVSPEDVDRSVIGAGRVSVDGDSRVERSRDVQVHRILVGRGSNRIGERGVEGLRGCGGLRGDEQRQDSVHEGGHGKPSDRFGRLRSPRPPQTIERIRYQLIGNNLATTQFMAGSGETATPHRSKSKQAQCAR